MPVFFEMHSTVEPLTRRRNADALAEILQDSLKPFDVRVVDGPFTETKELIGGFSIVEVGSKQEAIELAQRVARIHEECGVDELEIEVRPLYEHGECGGRQAEAA